VTVPGAGQVWWRAAIRARLEAAETAARPFIWLYGALIVSAVVLAVAWSPLAWSSVMNLPVWALDRAAAIEFSWIGAAGSPPVVSLGWMLVMLLAIGCVLAPLALYLTPDD
jgi:hypothetical protein